MLRRFADVDWSLLLVTLVLGVIGVITLANSTDPTAGYATRQALWLGIGVVLLVVTMTVDYRTWGDWAGLIYLLNGAALVVVLVLGRRINGSQSWIDVGPLNVQPSEFMKICIVLLVARIIAKNVGENLRPGILFASAVATAAPLLLVAMQPDLGTALTYGAVWTVFLFAGGMPKKAWALMAVVGVIAVGFGWNMVLKDYQRARIRTFVSPEVDAKAIGYQIIQSRIAIGSGGLTGTGFEQGTQSRLDFLPEKHTDFVFAVVAEAWGFAGSLAILSMYIFLIWRGLEIGFQARDAFGTYLVLGVMSLLTIHVLVNLGMVMGLLPTIGIPLPLMSYGGSSMLTTLVGIGLVLNVRMRRIVNR